MHRAMAMLVAAGLAASACAQSREWDGGGGSTDWFQDLNWDPDGVPESSDAVIVQGAVVTAAAADVDVRSLIVDDGMILDSRSLNLAEPSRITNFTLRGCCTRWITAEGMLTISGTSAFLKGTKFRGGGSTTIAGTAVSQELMNPDGHTLTIAGALTAAGNISPQNGGVVEVTGSLRLLETANIQELSGGATRLWPGGEIGIAGTTGDDQSVINARLRGTGGRLFAERGILDLRGEYDLLADTLEPTDGGQIWLSGSFPNEIDGITFGGTGTIELRNSNNTYTGALTASTAAPGSVDVYSTLRLNGLLHVDGSLRLRSARVESPGGEGAIGVLASGLLDVTDSTTQVPVDVFSGGILQIHESSLTPEENVYVASGAELRLSGGSTIQKPSGGSVGSLFVEGALCAFPFDRLPTNERVQVPLELRPGGNIVVTNGSLVLNGGGSWTGGTLRCSGVLGDGIIQVDGFDVTHFIAGDVSAVAERNGIMHIGGTGHTLNVIGAIRTRTTGGVLYLRGKNIGPGEIVNEQGRLTLYSGCDIGATIVNNAELLVDGNNLPMRGGVRNEGLITQLSGSFRFEGGTATNEGLWEINGPVNQELGSGGILVNNANYHVLPGWIPDYTHTVRVRFDNRGAVLARDAHAVFDDVVQIVDGELTAGVWEAEGSGSITFFGTTVHTIKGQGTKVRGDNEQTPLVDDVARVEDGAEVDSGGDSTRDGAVEIDGGRYKWNNGAIYRRVFNIRGTGSFGLGDGARARSDEDINLHSVLGDIQGVIAQAALPAPATIEAPNVLSHGRLIPGGEDRAGQFDFIGNLTQYGDGQLLIDVGGSDNTDVVTVTGAATIDGALRINLIDEFTPQGGESFTLITAAGGVFGQFSIEDLPELSGGLEWDVSYTGTEVILSVSGGCIGDWNDDGVVNTLDFIAFLNDWSSGDPDADINGDGNVNTLDFIAFLNAWSGGC